MEPDALLSLWSLRGSVGRKVDGKHLIAEAFLRISAGDAEDVFAAADVRQVFVRDCPSGTVCEGFVGQPPIKGVASRVHGIMEPVAT